MSKQNGMPNQNVVGDRRYTITQHFNNQKSEQGYKLVNCSMLMGHTEDEITYGDYDWALKICIKYDLYLPISNDEYFNPKDDSYYDKWGEKLNPTEYSERIDELLEHAYNAGYSVKGEAHAAIIEATRELVQSAKPGLGLGAMSARELKNMSLGEMGEYTGYCNGVTDYQSNLLAALTSTEDNHDS
tara:strand:- start:14063 stop:14620 length:558 start_codon:yes stop_codon:yes gene_type:complete